MKNDARRASRHPVPVDPELVELATELLDHAVEGLPSDQLVKATAWCAAPASNDEVHADAVEAILRSSGHALVDVDNTVHAKVIANYGDRPREFSTRLFARITIVNLLHRGRAAQANWRAERQSHEKGDTSDGPTRRRKEVRDALRLLDTMQASRQELEQRFGAVTGLQGDDFSVVDQFLVRTRSLIEESVYDDDIAKSQQDVIDYAVVRTKCRWLRDGSGVPSTDADRKLARQLVKLEHALRSHPMRKFNPAIDRVLQEDHRGFAYRVLLTFTVDGGMRAPGAGRKAFIGDDVRPTYRRLFGIEPPRSYRSEKQPFVRFCRAIFAELGEAKLNSRTIREGLARRR